MKSGRDRPHKQTNISCSRLDCVPPAALCATIATERLSSPCRDGHATDNTMPCKQIWVALVLVSLLLKCVYGGLMYAAGMDRRTDDFQNLRNPWWNMP